MTRAEMRAAVVDRQERLGMSYRNIATDLGITLGSVEWHLKAHRKGTVCRVDGVMSSIQRRCSDLYLSGKSYPEIGRMVGLNRNQVAGLVHRARKFGIGYRGDLPPKPILPKPDLIRTQSGASTPPTPPRPAMWALAEFDPVIARAARERLILSMAA